MRSVVALGLLFALAIPITAFAQGLPESSFLIKLRYTKVDLPRSSSSTCIAVFPDGRFHLEHNKAALDRKPDIFEDSLTEENLKNLTSLLDDSELKELPGLHGKGTLVMTQGEIVWAKIARGETTQNLMFTSTVGRIGTPAKVLPNSLNALVGWSKATLKDLDQRRVLPLKHQKAVKCWLDN